MIKGKEKLWSFDVHLDPKYLDEWLEDGLEIDEVFYSIPEYIVNLGLTKMWCKCSDIFNFRWCEK
jgi:hypothetical protein